MTPEPVALVDMDGTLVDYDGPMRKALNLLRSPEEPPIPEDSHDAPAWMQARIKLIRSQPGFWRNLPHIELGFAVFNILSELGYKNTILTKGPTNTTIAWSEKRDWCHQHVPGFPVTVTEDKGLVYGRVLFDDYPEYITRWLVWRPRGLVLMLEQPWNKDFKHPNVMPIRSEDDFPEMRQRLIAARDR